MNYEQLSIPLARLRLNKENDRHGPLASELDCIQWMLTNLGDEIFKLAKDIAKHWLSPIDGVLVLPDSEIDGDYVVWEGNRRITAVKLLDDPNRAPDARSKRRYAELRSKARASILDAVECTVAPSVEEAERLIELRHQGPQEGIGTLHWNAQQKSRHQQRLGKRGRYDFSHQVIDAFADKLDPYLRDQVTDSDFAISTLDRLLRNPDIRDFLGIASEEGMARRFLRESETLKGLTKILRDIANGMPVRDVYDADKQREYISGFASSETPDARKTLRDSRILTPVEPPTPRPPVVRSIPFAHKRSRLIPSDVKYRIKDKRLNSIYRELRELSLADFRNATAVLMRVFLELSVEVFLSHHQVPFHNNDKLSKKIGKAVEHMKENQWLDSKRAKGIQTATSTQHSSFSVDTFHAYVHNRNFHPEATTLTTTWDNIQPFFDSLFGNLD